MMASSDSKIFLERNWKKSEKRLDGFRTVGFKAGVCGIGMEISVQGCVGLGYGCNTSKWDVDGCVL